MAGARIILSGPILTQPAATAARIAQRVDATLLDIGLAGQRLVQTRTPVGASFKGAGLYDSIFHELRGSPIRRSVLISHGRPYGDIVEAGRRPGLPPFGPILWWVRRKVGLSGRQAFAFARYVQKKIGRAGYIGFGMFKRTMPEVEALVRRVTPVLQAEIAAIMNGTR